MVQNVDFYKSRNQKFTLRIVGLVDEHKQNFMVKARSKLVKNPSHLQAVKI